MWKVTGVAIAALAGFAAPASAESSPNMVGAWTCDPAPMLIRGQWTEQNYSMEVDEQKDGLFTGQMHWSLSEDKKAAGNQDGKSSYSGTIKVLGAVGWDGTSVEMVAYGDGHRHHGTFVDPDTIRFVHSETGDNAWISRTVCHRDAG